MVFGMLGSILSTITSIFTNILRKMKKVIIGITIASIFIGMIALGIVITVLVLLFKISNSLEKSNEGFQQDRYLYPEMDPYCEKEGLDTATQPQICCVDEGETCDYFRNCRCKDPNTGMCKKCWGEIKMYTQ